LDYGSEYGALGERRGAERPGRSAIDHQLDVNTVVGKLKQVYAPNFLVKLLYEIAGILGANAE
jgi:hypothetical protein